MEKSKQQKGHWKKSLSKLGKRISFILQLPNATNYTGHCWIHTAVNLCGDKNMSVDQICVNVTGMKTL